MERLAAAERARRRRSQRAKGLAAGTTVALVLIVIVTATSARRGEAGAIGKIEAGGACEVDKAFDSDSGPGRNHVEGPIAYETSPPGGGNHSASPSPAGIFTAENAPPDTRVVHSLEHGYVAVWYRSDLPEPDLARLRALAGRHRKDVLLLPRASMRDPVAATAWHRRALCSGVNTEGIEEFVKFFVNKGPEKVPHP